MGSLVGTIVVRKEDPNLLTGRGRYTDDLTLPGMVHAAFARSTEAHGIIRSVDTSAGRAMPGVVAVYTAADLPDLPLLPGPPIPGLERPCLATDRVRFVGEMVAVVVAQTRYQAADAAAAIEIDIEPLPAVPTIEQAMSGEAAEAIWPAMGGNMLPLIPLDEAAAEAALAGCAHRFSLRLRNTRCAPVPMECNAYLADWGPSGLTFWLTTQAGHHVRNQLAATFGLGHHECRVITPEVGGGFGAKVSWYPEHYLLPVLSRKLGKPVKYAETRSENLLSMVHGRDQVHDVEVGCDGDGKVQVLKVAVHSNLGAYADPTGFALPVVTTWMASGIYDIPQVFTGVTNWFTNQTSLAAYRGAGRPEASFLTERVMDLVADELGLDPLDVRRRNMITGPFPHTVPHTGGAVNYDSGNYPAMLDKLLENIDYPGLLAEQAANRDDPSKPLIGIGFSTWLEIAGFGPRGSLEGFGHLGSWESTRLRILPDGSAHITTGASPHGQGTYTTLAMIASDVLGIPFDRITVAHGDTDLMPQGIGTMGSRATPVAGGAVWTSANAVLERAKKIAAHLLEAAEADIVVEDGAFHVAGSPDRSKTWAEIGTAGFQGASLPDGLRIGCLEELTHFEPSNFTFPSGAYCCVVEIDRETGRVRVRDFVAVDDCGVVINPLLAAGQVMGGVAQGIAQALFESVEYDPESGQPRTATLLDYLVPSAAEYPSFILDHIETPTPSNPLGAKGLGESGAVGATPAVVNAVVDALSHLGVRDVAMPCSPQRVWQHLSAQG